MSLVTTPSSSSDDRFRQTAATRELFPVPTGPPIPTLMARTSSAGKEPPLVVSVGERAQLDEWRRDAGQLGPTRRQPGEPCHLSAERCHPGGGGARINGHQLH